ncbi:MAG: TolC family protein, partial [Verrucomicrobia bacterium]|nr:TolC family protein [Verrucomicrobiota bacterium]
MKIRLSSAVPGAVLATLPVLLAAQNLAAQTSEELLEQIDLQDEVIAEASAEVDEAENNFAQAEADLAQCRIENARCEELVSRRAAAQEAVAQAVADLEAAQRNFQRVEALFQQGVVSRVEFEAAENDLAVAENNLGTREAELAVIESQLEQCEEEEASTPNPACEDAAAQVAIREEERQEAEARRAAALAVRADLVADLENTVVKENRPDPVQTTVLDETPQI